MKRLDQLRVLSLATLAVVGTGQAFAQAPSVFSPANDLALNKDTSLSDDGWGGGSSKTDITAGQRMYGTYPQGVDWARGLALPWDGQTHQITIDFGAQTTLGSVIQWHHGAGPWGMGAETPASYTIKYWNSGIGNWSTIMSTQDPAQFMKCPNAQDPQDWFAYWSTPYENTFAPVTTDKLRIEMTAQPGRYNWLYQVEAYAPVPEPATMAVLGMGVAALLRRRRK